jgi:Ni/Co efflux regulator RcnB
MKPFRSMLLGLALVSASAVAFAQPPHDDHGRDNDHGHDQRHDDHRSDHRDWSRGHALPPEYRGRDHYVTDWRSHRLRQPPRGYRWVQADNQFVLVAVTTGIIADIIANQQ